MSALYADADALVLPSYAEGFAMSLDPISRARRDHNPGRRTSEVIEPVGIVVDAAFQFGIDGCSPLSRLQRDFVARVLRQLAGWRSSYALDW